MNYTWSQLSRSLSTITWKKKTLLTGYTLYLYVKMKVKVKVMWSRSPTGSFQSPFNARGEKSPKHDSFSGPCFNEQDCKIPLKALEKSKSPCLSFHSIRKGSNNLLGHLTKNDLWLLNTLKIMGFIVSCTLSQKFCKT